jgi:hypothetical protein
MWSFRLMQEDRHSLSSYFITLTYDNKHIPISNKGYMNLDKRDIQLFMKRLRKNNKEKLKYYIAGEYGGKTNRPHYHMILFNSDITTIQDSWQKGHVHYGQVSEASVGYTLKYMIKETKVPIHKNDDRKPEFQLMSKGLGKEYLTTKMQKWHKADLLNRMYLNVEGNKKIPMPRYYKDKLYNKDERGQIKSKFSEQYQKQLDNMLSNPEEANVLITQIINQQKHDKTRIKQDQQKRGN